VVPEGNDEQEAIIPMNVNLTPELEQYVQEKVKSGRYNSASEVVRESLRTQLDQDSRRKEINRLIDEGIASGEAIDGEQAFAQIREYTDKRKKEIAAAKAARPKKAA